MEGQAAALRSGGLREACRRPLCTIPAWLLLPTPPGPSCCCSINYISQFSRTLKFCFIMAGRGSPWQKQDFR